VQALEVGVDFFSTEIHSSEESRSSLATHLSRAIFVNTFVKILRHAVCGYERTLCASLSLFAMQTVAQLNALSDT
jgi:hypothetical protein